MSEQGSMLSAVIVIGGNRVVEKNKLSPFSRAFDASNTVISSVNTGTI